MKKLLLVLVVAALVAAAVFLSRRSNSDAAVVTVESLENRSLRASILASGKLSHEQEVMLSTEVIGRVAALYVKEGDQVSEGQLVAQIDDEAPRAMVEQQRASTRMQEIAIESQKLRLKNLETQWERKRQVHARQLLDDDSFEAATNELELARLDVQTREASLAQARAMLEEAEKNLSRTRVLSPLAGVVSSLDIKVGEMAISSTTNVPGSSLMTIGNPSSIHTEVNVDEADIADIKVGQEAEVVAIGYPDSPMRGRVKEIAITAKPPTQTSTALSFVVKIAIDDSNGVVLHPGMSSRAEIFTSNNENLPSVPIAAVLLEEDRSLGSKKNYVFRFDDGVARKIEVGLGIADDTYQAIRSGLTLGDRFITGPNRVLRDLEDGDPVREAEEQDGTASSDSGRE
ncbi:MAG: efflux RND transporter periplasmic adaptor subunit [Pseudohongiellaceae bacterium]|jgi:HlyD family secretion protein